jgi:hypothetical protein
MVTDIEKLEELEQKIKFEKLKREMEEFAKAKKKEVKNKRKELFNLKYGKYVNAIKTMGKELESTYKSLYKKSKKIKF